MGVEGEVETKFRQRAESTRRESLGCIVVALSGFGALSRQILSSFSLSLSLTLATTSPNRLRIERLCSLAGGGSWYEGYEGGRGQGHTKSAVKAAEAAAEVLRESPALGAAAAAETAGRRRASCRERGVAALQEEWSPADRAAARWAVAIVRSRESPCFFFFSRGESRNKR